MAPIFRPSANIIARASVLGVVILVPVLLVGLYFIYRSPLVTGVDAPVEQPVPYSHVIHVNNLKLDCRYCHTGVERTAFAGIPATETCMTCHSQIKTDSPNLAAVRQSWESGNPIPWNKVHDLADFAYFNHSIHVAKGVGCVTCHGRVDQMSQVRKTQPLTMGWCLDCHRAPERYLRPREEVFNMAWQPPEDQLALGRRLVQEYHIDVSRLTNCSICHR